MSNGISISRFTPSLLNLETLEGIFVQRHPLAERLVELHNLSTPQQSKHHTLLIGARGIGKTHLVSLVYHRLKTIQDLDQRQLIAWLREEEWGVSSYLDLLMRILRALLEIKNNEVNLFDYLLNFSSSGIRLKHWQKA